MVAYSFKRQFIEPILAGTKDQTIRLERWSTQGHAKAGQGVQLYIGIRTQARELILRTVGLGTVPVRLIWRPVIEVILDGERLPTSDFDAFARRDGFADFDGMERFWAETHPGFTVFPGRLIRWQAPASPVEMGATVAMPALAKAKEAA